MLRCKDCGSTEAFLLARTAYDYGVYDGNGDYLDETPEGHVLEFAGASEYDVDMYAECLACHRENIEEME